MPSSVTSQFMLGVVSIAIDVVTGTVVLEVIVHTAWQMVQLQVVSFYFISSRKEQHYKESSICNHFTAINRLYLHNIQLSSNNHVMCV